MPFLKERSPRRPWPSRPPRRRLLLHPRHNFVSRSRTPSLEASVLPRLPKVRSYLRSVQVGQFLQRDVTHRLAGSLQNSGRIIQVRATRESEEYMSSKYVDVADAVSDDSFRRAIQQNNLRAHLEDVLVTRGHFLMNHLPKAQGKRLDAGIVPIEEFEQLGWRSCHATLTNGDGSALGRQDVRPPLPPLVLRRFLDACGDGPRELLRRTQAVVPDDESGASCPSEHPRQTESRECC